MTQLVDLRLDRLRLPFRRGVRFGSATVGARDVGLVALQAEDGTLGWGEVVWDAAASSETGSPSIGSRPGPGTASAGSGPGSWSAVEGLVGRARASLVGREVADTGRLFLDGVGSPTDESTPLGRAVAGAVETAVLDLLGRRLGRSFGSFFAGRRAPSVAVNALLPVDDALPDEVVAEAQGWIRRGVRTLKLKAGEPARLAAILRAIRGAVGDRVALRVDWNGSLSEAEAVERLRGLASADLEYVEDPLPATSGPEALARLRRAVPVPIALDEAVTDPGAAAALLAAEACDVLVVKPGRVGGPRAALRIVEAAAGRGVAVTISSLYETGIGLAAALHVAAAVPGDRAHGLATADLLVDDVVVEPFNVVDGRVAVPGGPGLGVTVDEAAIARYRLEGDRLGVAGARR